MKEYDWARALGATLILEYQLSSAGQREAGRPENRHGGCFDSGPHASNTGFENRYLLLDCVRNGGLLLRVALTTPSRPKVVRSGW